MCGISSVAPIFSQHHGVKFTGNSLLTLGVSLQIHGLSYVSLCWPWDRLMTGVHPRPLLLTIGQGPAPPAPLNRIKQVQKMNESKRDINKDLQYCCNRQSSWQGQLCYIPCCCEECTFTLYVPINSILHAERVSGVLVCCCRMLSKHVRM